jgi:chromosome segregation ATPase
MKRLPFLFAVVALFTVSLGFNPIYAADDVPFDPLVEHAVDLTQDVADALKDAESPALEKSSELLELSTEAVTEALEDLNDADTKAEVREATGDLKDALGDLTTTVEYIAEVAEEVHAPDAITDQLDQVESAIDALTDVVSNPDPAAFNPRALRETAAAFVSLPGSIAETEATIGQLESSLKEAQDARDGLQRDLETAEATLKASVSEADRYRAFLTPSGKVFFVVHRPAGADLVLLDSESL